VGGYLTPTYNVRYATKIGIEIFDYSNNPLFISKNSSLGEITKIISNPVISLGEIYDRRMNFSALGQDVLDITALINDQNSSSTTGIEIDRTTTIEGSAEGGSTTLTNLVLYENELYYLSPLGTRGTTEESSEDVKIFPGILDDA
jgi:hypothetical protein